MLQAAISLEAITTLATTILVMTVCWLAARRSVCGLGVCLEMCLQVCVDVCVDAWFDVRIDMCLDVCSDACFDIYIDVCIDVCLDVFRNAPRHVFRCGPTTCA